MAYQPKPSGAKTYIASQIPGVVLDCDITTGTKIGGGTPTDNTTKLIAILATATATSPVKLIIDGGSLITGLVLPVVPYIEIEGLGFNTGFFNKAGSNNYGISNVVTGAAPFNVSWDPGSGAVPSIAPDSYVKLRSFKLNGNRGSSSSINTGNTDGVSSGVDPHGNRGNITWLTGIDLNSIDTVYIEDVQVYDAPTYHIRVLNINNLFVTNPKILSNSPLGVGFNTDGIHVSGGAKNVHIKGGYYHCSDDAIALNPCEGFAQTIGSSVIEDIWLDNCLTGIRLEGGTSGAGNTAGLTNSTIRNVNGGVQYSCFVHGNESGSTLAHACGRVLYENCNISSNLGVLSYLMSGSIQTVFDKVRLIGAVSGGQMISVYANGFGRPIDISELIIRDSVIEMTAGAHDTSQVLLYGDAGFGSQLVIDKLVIDGFSVRMPTGAGYSPLAYILSLKGMAIGELIINSLDGANITNLCNGALPSAGYDSITKISGEGLLASTLEVPDALVVNGVPFMSNVSHVPSIKTGGTKGGINGVVKAL